MTPADQRLFERAIASFQTGALDEAERAFAKFLQRHPEHFGALNLLGVVLMQLRRLGDAEKILRRAIQVNSQSQSTYYNYGLVLKTLNRPLDALEAFTGAIALNSSDAEVWNNRGTVRNDLKQYREAIDDFQRAISLRPGYAEAYYNIGRSQQALGNLQAALAAYDDALKFNPRLFEALNNRALVLSELNRLEDALAGFERVLAMRPDFAEAHCSRGLTLEKLKRYEAALTSFDRALAITPDHADAHYNRGVVLYELKRLEDALASFDRALAIKPDHAEALYNRGVTLYELKRLEEALVSYDRALAVNSDFIAALYNRGVTLYELVRPEEALASYDRVMAIKPDYDVAIFNRGATLVELKRFEEAFASYDRALAIKADYGDAHFNKGGLHLLLGEFARGWKEYEWRWEIDQQNNARRDFAQPLWLGDAEIADKTILLHAEQGFGDTIQFCRYAALVAEQGARVVLEVQPALKGMLGELAGAHTVVAHGEPLPPFDLHCPLASLPLAFDTRLETIPAKVPYLFVPQTYATKWNQRLSNSGKLRVGISWAGNPHFKRDRSRSIGLLPMLPLFGNSNVEFYAIQKDLRPKDAEILQDNPRIVNLGREIETFADTAAIISILDLIISSDTSVVHLAGALGRPVWVLLSYIPDWRWLLDREDSPWYPTARLFRQPAHGDWASVIQKVADALGELALHRARPTGQLDQGSATAGAHDQYSRY